MSLGITTSDKLVQLLLDLAAGEPQEYTDLPTYYYGLGDALYHEGRTQDECTMAGLKYGYWKVYQEHVMDRTDYNFDEFRALNYTQWRDAVLFMGWTMPKMYRLKYECIAVALAYKYLRYGNKVIKFLQQLSDMDYASGEIDYSTAWTIRRFAPTRQQARELAMAIMRWRPHMNHLPSHIIAEGEETPPEYYIIGQLDLTFEEKAAQYKN